MKKSILILTSYPDPHIDRVLEILNKNGKNSIALYANMFGKNQYVEYNPKENEPLTFVLRVKKYTLNDFSGLWFRKPHLWLESEDQHDHDPDKMMSIMYKRNEIIAMFSRGIMNEAQKKGIFIINSIDLLMLSSNKLDQLNTANKLGFSIPETLISADYDSLLSFISNHDGKAVIKNIVTSQIRYGKYSRLFFTIPITKNKFVNYHKLKPIDYPLFLQEEIEKKIELRITIIGKKVFATALDSQSTKLGKTDWRREIPENIKHSVYILPIEIEKGCLDLLRHYHLQFGTIDMAVTPEGKYVFFELNPNGQYLWIENLTKQPLSKAIAELLMNPEENKLV
ncbi:hypothetical protein A3C23_00910 [Candidatus Roizmanbacteria bacterium RIFCSPHIGHO2_02_FULL_37_13b]|uniref:ATP-grasp domain-containing protein n=1 Tax=Candidatus Roizmanbacteria bacterium RIFCSPLOWO2_02_FULL_36_11 TaxID=1802071 RepID=A0A1F7JIV2_9BACT|nr:MAG: hypothetical protein A3C23_00910 [Candidatus Roizmanbacteria bacterium RIFCSPHIGHO2_02_FULL_37_13b]OGK55545.1 MAG: hypothetical protein A3H78_05275 [Candidatus Roizmanbacteria bacterium RIFCSPLOWO2_02_FULL_36_11]